MPEIYPPLDPDPGRSRGFNPANNHYGIDYNCWTGAEVYCCADGTVLRVANETGGYGNIVEIRHDDGWTTRYAHLSRVDVAAGEYVNVRQLVGLSGGAAGAPGAGNSTGPHLHYETRWMNNPVDPDNVLIPWPNEPYTRPTLHEGDCMRMIQNNPATGGDGKWYLVTCNGLQEIPPLDVWNFAIAGIPHSDQGSGPVIIALDQAIQAAKT